MGPDSYWFKQYMKQDLSLSGSLSIVLLMVAFVTLGPALCRPFLRTLHVVLALLLSALMIILSPWEENLHAARQLLSKLIYSHQLACLL